MRDASNYDGYMEGIADMGKVYREMKERINVLQSERDQLKQSLAEAEELILYVSNADCPNYMAHPQSVWWDIHVVEKAREYLAKKDGKNEI